MQDDNDNQQIAVVSNTFGDVNPNQVLEQGQKIIALMESIGIRDATFNTGLYFSHNAETQVKTVASDGVMMIQQQHTTHLVFRNEGSTPSQALGEVAELTTQKANGAFSGKSQPWVSNQLEDKS